MAYVLEHVVTGRRVAVELVSLSVLETVVFWPLVGPISFRYGGTAKLKRYRDWKLVSTQEEETCPMRK